MTNLDRYNAALHAIQSGIAVLESHGDPIFTPKHTRVGIDSAHVSDAALAQLLLRKGLFTLEEYYESLALAAEQEVARLEAELMERYGVSVKLA